MAKVSIWNSASEMSLEIGDAELQLDGQSDNAEVIHARYVIACDGARTWTSAQLNVDSDVWKTESTWGVMDIVPDTEFRMEGPGSWLQA